MKKLKPREGNKISVYLLYACHSARHCAKCLSFFICKIATAIPVSQWKIFVIFFRLHNQWMNLNYFSFFKSLAIFLKFYFIFKLYTIVLVLPNISSQFIEGNRYLFHKFQKFLCFHRLREFAKLYDTIRNERNKFINLLHKAHQKVNEIKERHKMSLNELEILRNSAVTQER